MSEQDARTKLKAAVAEFNELTKKIENLESATARAAEALEQAKAEVETHIGLDREITRWRVSQVKKGASTKVLPEKLAAKVEARKVAESEVEQAEATLAALREELTELRKSAKPLEEAQQTTAVGVLFTEHVDELAREYAGASIRERELRLLLHGLAHMRVQKNGRLEDVGYTQSMIDALRPGDQFPQEVSPQADMGTRWQRRLEALLKDPDATIARPIVIVPSDYVRTNAEAIVNMGFGMLLPAEYKVKHPVD